MSGPSLLSINNLSVRFHTYEGAVDAVRDVSLELRKGEILGLVGETGSGKSVTCKALTRLLPESAEIRGSVLCDGVDLLQLSRRDILKYRGRTISMIFQDPLSCLNPIKSIYFHLKEVLIKEKYEGDYRKRAKKILKKVHIPKPGRRLKDYPFQFSGGMAQRVQIAMARAGSPKILIADEPTTALDVTIQAKILNEICGISRKKDLAVILVTHDLAVVSRICDRVAIMYHGVLVEQGTVREILENTKHPYTRALFSSVPHFQRDKRPLVPIPGEILPARKSVEGCDFADRCGRCAPPCREGKPPLTKTQSDGEEHQFRCFRPLEDLADELGPSDVSEADESFSDQPVHLEAKGLNCSFKIKGEGRRSEWFPVLKNVSLSVRRGEIYGIVGESGSGKSTLAKCIMGLEKFHSGKVRLGGSLLREEIPFKEYCSRVQYVFQDPLGALDPRITILEQVTEPLIIHGSKDRQGNRKKALGILEECGLNEEAALRKPYNLSGGQRQRAVVARALVNEPELLICDEPVSAMDVSVQAQVLNLLKELVKTRDLTILFISHDLSVVSNLCHRVGVLYGGRFVETAPMGELYDNPRHPYTKMLLESVPRLEIPETRGFPVSSDGKAEEIPGGGGCAYRPRCPLAGDMCEESIPELEQKGEGHEAACFFC